jgi:hypothetical protein
VREGTVPLRTDRLIMATLCVGDSHVRRFRSFIGHSHSSRAHNISALQGVRYFGISGGKNSVRSHADRITTTVQHYAPRHVIFILGGNDLDSTSFDLDCFVFRLVTFLTQIRNQPTVRTVTILSLFGRQRTRTVPPRSV